MIGRAGRILGLVLLVAVAWLALAGGRAMRSMVRKRAGVTAGSNAPDRSARPVVDPDWSDRLLEIGRWNGVALVTLEPKPGAGVRVAYAGRQSELLAALESIEQSGLPLTRVWLGPGSDTDPDRMALRLEIGGP